MEVIQLSKLEDEKRKGNLNLDFLKRGRNNKQKVADNAEQTTDHFEIKVDPSI